MIEDKYHSLFANLEYFFAHDCASLRNRMCKLFRQVSTLHTLKESTTPPVQMSVLVESQCYKTSTYCITRHVIGHDVSFDVSITLYGKSVNIIYKDIPIRSLQMGDFSISLDCEIDSYKKEIEAFLPVSEEVDIKPILEYFGNVLLDEESLEINEFIKLVIVVGYIIKTYNLDAKEAIRSLGKVSAKIGLRSYTELLDATESLDQVTFAQVHELLDCIDPDDEE